MTRYILILTIALSAAASSGAQSFTDNLQRKQQGKGNVSVRQSTEIDELVNGKKKAPKTKEQLKAERKAAKRAQKEAKRREKEARKAAKEGKRTVAAPKFVPQKPVVVAPRLPEEKVVVKPVPDLSRVNRTKTKLVRRVKIGEDGKPVMRKVMKTVVYSGVKKVNGYRVQVFSGGNKREDRNAAEQAGHKVKAAFPDQPVYVHFHSPRWACRIGNFTEKKDAYALLKEIKKLGFKQAVVIESKVAMRDYKVIE